MRNLTLTDDEENLILNALRIARDTYATHRDTARETPGEVWDRLGDQFQRQYDDCETLIAKIEGD